MGDSLRPGYDFALADLANDPSSRGRVFRALSAGSRVLDVGCDTGRFGEALRREKGCEVHGLERDAVAASEAAKRLDRVHTRSIDGESAFDDLRDFDAILFLDVLEHLYDPWAVLRGALQTLRPGGALHAVLPNVAHVSVVRRLLRGRFEYEQHGTMDRTHIRWFTRATFADALTSAGFTEVSVGVVPLVPYVESLPRVGGLVARQLADWFPDQLGGSIVATGRRPA